MEQVSLKIGERSKEIRNTRHLEVFYIEFDAGVTHDSLPHVVGVDTIRSFLSWLKDTGKVDAVFRDSMLLWQRIWEESNGNRKGKGIFQGIWDGGKDSGI